MGAAQNAHALNTLMSQHRLLELSRFGLRGYDLAQHMMNQQTTVSKLLGKLRKVSLVDFRRSGVPEGLIFHPSRIQIKTT